MITEHKILSYTIDSHPNPEVVYDWIRANWHDLGEFDSQEFLASFEALAEYLGVRCDYSFGTSPDRGQFLTLIGQIDQEQIDSLKLGEYKLTGMCYDDSVIKALKYIDLEDWAHGKFNICSALSDLHTQGEWLYSDEALKEHCEANEYQFLANGEFYQ